MITGNVIRCGYRGRNTSNCVSKFTESVTMMILTDSSVAIRKVTNIAIVSFHDKIVFKLRTEVQRGCYIEGLHNILFSNNLFLM